MEDYEDWEEIPKESLKDKLYSKNSEESGSSSSESPKKRKVIK